MKSNYLNDSELLALQLLAEGYGSNRICREIGFTRSSTHYSMFLAELRRKTGLKSLKEPEDIKAYLQKLLAVDPYFTPSPEEDLWLRDIMDDLTMEGLARKYQISLEEYTAKRKALLHRCGIFATDQRTIRAQVRLFFATHPLPTINRNRPLSPEHWSILRAIANGEDLAELGFAPDVLKSLTKEACERIRATSPGRGARLLVVQAFIRANGKPVTMDDPMF